MNSSHRTSSSKWLSSIAGGRSHDDAIYLQCQHDSGNLHTIHRFTLVQSSYEKVESRPGPDRKASRLKAFLGRSDPSDRPFQTPHQRIDEFGLPALPTFVLVLFDVPLVVYGWFADAKPYNAQSCRENCCDDQDRCNSYSSRRCAERDPQGEILRWTWSSAWSCVCDMLLGITQREHEAC